MGQFREYPFKCREKLTRPEVRTKSDRILPDFLMAVHQDASSWLINDDDRARAAATGLWATERETRRKRGCATLFRSDLGKRLSSSPGRSPPYFLFQSNLWRIIHPRQSMPPSASRSTLPPPLVPVRTTRRATALSLRGPPGGEYWATGRTDGGVNGPARGLQPAEVALMEEREHVAQVFAEAADSMAELVLIPPAGYCDRDLSLCPSRRHPSSPIQLACHRQFQWYLPPYACIEAPETFPSVSRPNSSRHLPSIITSTRRTRTASESGGPRKRHLPPIEPTPPHVLLAQDGPCGRPGAYATCILVSDALVPLPFRGAAIVRGAERLLHFLHRCVSIGIVDGITLNERQIFGGAGSMADESPIPQRIPVRLGVEPLGTMSKLFRRASVLTFEVLVARLTTNGVAKLKSRKEKIRVTASSAIAWVKRILSSPTLNAAVQNGTTALVSVVFDERRNGKVVQTGFNVPLNDGINSWCHRSFFLEGGKSDCNSAIEIYEIYERFPVPYDFDQSDSDPDSLATKKFR
ncbi:hypothetical protein DFH09DRAFT_1289680 [Mycena vulgaris]|nr:hypothetical protein DFH09DRAFT_1289680 [Mycena vulgaris]